MFNFLFLFFLVSQKNIDIERENAIVKAVKKAENSVVSITCFSTRYVSLAPFSILNDPFFREFFEFFDFPEYKEKISSQGSGFIISEDGFILTNEHVIHNSDSIIVTLPDGRRFNADLIGKDYSIDVALLKINGEKFPYLKFADSDKLERGEWAIAMGNPFGYLWEDTKPTCTAGVVSALERTFKGEKDRIYRGMIQTDAAINPGNSGGPLLNAEGEVIGMNTFIVSKSGGFEGIGFAIPSNTLKEILPYLKEFSYYPRGFLGISAIPSQKGVKLEAVFKEGPAGKIGLKPEDIIIKIGKKIIKNFSDYRRYLDLLKSNEEVVILIERNGKKDVLNIKTIPRYKGILKMMGIEIEENKKGVYISKIQRKSYAEKIGLKEGDYIISIEDYKIKNIEDFKRVFSEYLKREKRWEILRGRYTYEFAFEEMD